MDIETRLTEIARLIRYYILISTTKAGSGHPTSSLSGADLMTGLMFGGIFRFDIEEPHHPCNDRLIFSKGHASPLLYALWAVAGKVSLHELMTLRQFGSRLEGHPSPAFPYAEAATGSLGQGLSIGLGMALNGKYLDKFPYRTYVLIGDSEMTEGSQWESIQLAAYYKLDNLIGIMDVNRLGQRGETMHGHDMEAYEKELNAFGWKTICVDGHDFNQIMDAYNSAIENNDTPFVIIARTIKGKGVSFLEDKNGWHGKALEKKDLARALKELGSIDISLKGEIARPGNVKPSILHEKKVNWTSYSISEKISTRKAYGKALRTIYPGYPKMVVLDAEVSNSTKSEIFKKAYPDCFFEMFVGEQNMIGAAVGLALRGRLPFVSTFAAFVTRAFDQIRMSQYSLANIKICGSHAGVSIGMDGPSQMGLEDIAMFRAVFGSAVFYPCDGVSTEKLVEAAINHKGIVYLRTTREATPVIYDNNEEFYPGGCKVLRKSAGDRATVIGAGITVHEALRAYEELKNQGILIRVVDLYSVKPIDKSVFLEGVKGTEIIITVEDHYKEGGIGDAVRAVVGEDPLPVHSLAVVKMPKSGSSHQLLNYEKISAETIKEKVLQVV
jgi:transketolase